MKSMKLSKYFEIIHPEYAYVKLTPLKSIRNYNSDKIILAIASTYKSVLQRIRKQNKKYFFHIESKMSYYIYVEKGKVEFYFLIPVDYITLIKDKIGDTWNGITMEKVDSIPTFSADSIRYAMAYRKEDALSLSSDKRSNTLLASLMSTIDMMADRDKIGIFYNFIPCDQQPWRASYDSTINKIKNGLPIEKERTGAIFALKLLSTVLLKLSEFMSEVIADLTGGGNVKQITRNQCVLLPESTKKRDARIIKSQIVAFSSSTDSSRKLNNIISIGEGFKSISGDNELMYHRILPTSDLTKTYLSGADVMKMTASECSNFIALPGKELIERYKGIEHIDVLESEVPIELQSGDICIGASTHRGDTKPVYLTNDKDYKHLALVLIGATRSGKTTLISNIAHSSIEANQCTIILDFCGNCELSDSVSKHSLNTLEIDCSDFKHIQGLSYNEVNPNETDPFLQYRNAKMMSMQLITLIDCIVDEDNVLSSRMDRYLECASLISFISGGSINDVFQILQDHTIRKKFINQIPTQQIANLSEYVSGLSELDEYEKNSDEIVGTKYSLISGIIDRVNKLKQNTYMELMLKHDCKNNINLVNEMQKSQLICLKMPESMFSTEKEKDIYCTYWMTKIWLALQIRKRDFQDRTTVNIVVDELYQVPNCQDFIRSKLSQMAKFSAKMIISCHYLGQIKIIRNELKAANSSYVIISGSDKDNFSELKAELSPYEVEDVLNLKRYHALCLLKYEHGYAKLVVKLLKPL